MATKKKSNLSTIAKKSGSIKKTTTGQKKTTGNKDELAKKKVEELLGDLPIDPKKKDELLELDESQQVVDSESIEWLREQVGKLVDENAVLKKEADEAKNNYQKIFDDYQKLKSGKPDAVTDTDLRNNLVILFNELQTNYFKMGNNFVVVFPAFLNRMIKYFPFLEKQKKF